MANYHSHYFMVYILVLKKMFVYKDEIRNLLIKYTMNKLYLACLLFILNFDSAFAYAIKKGSSSFDFITIL